MANKTVTVNITTTTSGAARTIMISVDQDPVQLDDTVSLTEGIDWVIDDSSYWTFTTDNAGNSTGIQIKNPRGRFKDRTGNSGKKHGWIRNQKDNASTPYRYTVSVTNETREPDPAKWATISWDPLIQNN